MNYCANCLKPFTPPRTPEHPLQAVRCGPCCRGLLPVSCSQCGGPCGEDLTPEERADPDRLCPSCWEQFERDVRREFVDLVAAFASAARRRAALLPGNMPLAPPAGDN